MAFELTLGIGVVTTICLVCGRFADPNAFSSVRNSLLAAGASLTIECDPERQIAVLPFDHVLAYPRLFAATAALDSKCFAEVQRLAMFVSVFVLVIAVYEDLKSPKGNLNDAILRLFTSIPPISHDGFQGVEGRQRIGGVLLEMEPIEVQEQAPEVVL